MKRKPYPEYKDSGVQWLGQVPAHWEVDRCKWSIERVINGIWGSEPDEENDLVCVRVADFDRTAFRVIDEPSTIRAVETGQRGNRLLRKGDLLIEKSGGGEKQLVGCVVHYDLDLKAVCSNFVARMPIASEMNSRFWTYVHAGMYAGRINYPSIKQTTGIQNLDSASYLDERVVYPPLSEQTAIANFLDRETGRIDTLLEKKRRLIALLKEKRTALISRTVTRGLPEDAAREFGLEPHTRFKYSGVEWLGQVPEGWDVVPIKRIVSTPVTDGPHETPEILDDGVPFVSAEAINNGQINFDRIRGYISEDDHKRYSRKYKPEYGDIYMVKSGATTGRIAMVETDEEFNIWSPLAAIRCKSSIADRSYVYFYLQSTEFQKAVELHWSFGTQQNIGMGVIQNLSVPIGETKEQSAIATYLARETAKLDRLTDKVEAAIARLQEYRTALITAAVTGKIDVREAVA